MTIHGAPEMHNLADSAFGGVGWGRSSLQCKIKVLLAEEWERLLGVQYG